MKIKKYLIFIFIILSVGLLTGCADKKAYGNAEELFAEGKFEEAARVFEELGEYEDAAKRAKDARNEAAYIKAKNWFSTGSYTEAALAFEQLGSFKDSQELALEARNELAYIDAMDLYRAGRLKPALEAFKTIRDFRDSTLLAGKIEEELENIRRYENAENVLKSGEIYNALILFTALEDYKDSAKRVEEIMKLLDSTYAKADRLYHAGDYTEAATLFNSLKEYGDASERGRLSALAERKRKELAKGFRNNPKEIKSFTPSDPVRNNMFIIVAPITDPATGEISKGGYHFASARHRPIKSDDIYYSLSHSQTPISRLYPTDDPNRATYALIITYEYKRSRERSLVWKVTTKYNGHVRAELYNMVTGKSIRSQEKIYYPYREGETVSRDMYDAASREGIMYAGPPAVFGSDFPDFDNFLNQ